MRTTYPSNLSDAEWETLQRHLPPLPKRGRPPIHPLRAIFDAIFYVLRHHGCGIRVKTVEESAGISGFGASRKRHLLVDTLGIPISIYVTPADVHDTKGARCLLAGLAFFVPQLKKIWADAAYRGQELAEWCQITGSWELEVVERTPGTRGWSRVPRRWVVERTFSWISRNRRLSKDYERKVQTSETLIQVAMIRLLLARLGRQPRASPHTQGKSGLIVHDQGNDPI